MVTHRRAQRRAAGTPQPPAERLWLALNKPAGAATSRRDPDGGHTVYDYLPADLPVVEAVGRLDRATTGLLLFTNDHVVGQALLNPEADLPRVYQVVTNRPLPPHAPALLRQGVLLEDGTLCKSVRVEPLSEPAPGRSYRFTLKEGRHREVRRLVMHFQCKVRGLHRVSFGPIALGSLACGQTRHLSPGEVEALAAWGRRTLGRKARDFCP